MGLHYSREFTSSSIFIGKLTNSKIFTKQISKFILLSRIFELSGTFKMQNSKFRNKSQAFPQKLLALSWNYLFRTQIDKKLFESDWTSQSYQNFVQMSSFCYILRIKLHFVWNINWGKIIAWCWASSWFLWDAIFLIWLWFWKSCRFEECDDSSDRFCWGCGRV